MRYLFVLSLLLFSATDALAQRPGGRGGRGGGGQPPSGALFGVVEDDLTQTPLPLATVSVWKAADSSLVTGAVTTPDGLFRAEGLPPGRYYVDVSLVGYQTERLNDVTLRPPGEMSRDLGTIRLGEGTVLIEGAEVTAEREKVEIKLDRTVYNTKEQAVTASGTASDVLQNVPSVQVDADGNISLRGNSNVAIQINGRPVPLRGDQLAAFLQQLPAKNVERVEVVPNPSAKYEPDGMAGIVNIVLTENADLGLGGSISLGADVSRPGEVFDTNLGLTYGKGKTNVFASYGFQRRQRGRNSRTTTEDFLRGTSNEVTIRV